MLLVYTVFPSIQYHGELLPSMSIDLTFDLLPIAPGLQVWTKNNISYLSNQLAVAFLICVGT